MSGWWLCRAGEDCVSIMQRWATTVCSGPAPASQDTDLDILCGGGGVVGLVQGTTTLAAVL